LSLSVLDREEGGTSTSREREEDGETSLERSSRPRVNYKETTSEEEVEEEVVGSGPERGGTSSSEEEEGRAAIGGVRRYNSTTVTSTRRGVRKTGVIRNAAAIEALELATEQTLKVLPPLITTTLWLKMQFF
jgi:hypothetical protein